MNTELADIMHDIALESQQLDSSSQSDPTKFTYYLEYTDDMVELVALEQLLDDYFQTGSISTEGYEGLGLEAISSHPADFLNRYVSLAVGVVDGITEAVADELQEYEETVQALRSKIKTLKTSWETKRGTTVLDKVNLNYAGMHAYFYSNRHVIEEPPMDYIEDDLEVVGYILTKYGPMVGKEIKALSGQYKSANLSTDKTANSSIIKYIESRPHPGLEFDSKYRRNKPTMLGNHSLWTKHAIADKLINIFRKNHGTLSAKAHDIVPRISSSQLGKRGGVLHDFPISISDMDDYFKTMDRIFDVVEKGLGLLEDNKDEVVRLTASLDTLLKKAKGSDVSKDVLDKLKVIVRYSGVISKCGTAPVRDGLKHALFLQRGLYRFTKQGVRRF